MRTGEAEGGCDEFPRTYQMDKSTRHFFNGFAIFLLVFFGITSVLHLAGFMAHPLAIRDLALMYSFVALFALSTTWWANRRVILHRDAIELMGWWFKRRMDDLTGVFCTSRGEREFTRRTAGNAQQEVQSRTDSDVAASD